MTLYGEGLKKSVEQSFFFLSFFLSSETFMIEDICTARHAGRTPSPYDKVCTGVFYER